MRILLILLCSFFFIGATVVEKDPDTEKVLCSYDTDNTEGEVNIDKTRDIYVNDVLYRNADKVIVTKTKSIETVTAEMEVI